MKVNFLNENKVEVTVELDSVYKKPLKERISYNVKDAEAFFLKQYPKKKIKAVLEATQVNNFRQNGLVKGRWVFELVAKRKAHVPLPKVPVRKTTTKKKS